ncbi:TSUP family transporter [Alphaproteobacteria bacterium GH1-50]|uniref:Probable membrane transporter protein n=1 Tax=Kangsaoukella pontilimi TaxID=2691042 RepID=A0A7C9MUE8_9RHOB|nr:sulfite exporter TauE/SafE family protein [Kangsaoukella pontilimi]MXQ06840.1 TSUP family transporter [Kangsaoukella pontilimi]
MNEILLFLAAGFLGGAVNAAAGGAKLFVFPFLLASGLPPIAANVTQGVALWPAQLPAVWVYRAEIRAEFRNLFTLLIPAFLGALSGAIIMVNSSDAAFVGVVPFLLAIAVAAIVLGPRTTDLMRRVLPAARLKAATAVLMAATGFYGGFFGAGMGFMLLAVLSIATGRGLVQVNGAKNLFAFVIQSVAVGPMVLSGLVNWPAAVCVLIGGVIGGYGGAQLVRRLPENLVRLGVAALGVVLTLTFLAS